MRGKTAGSWLKRCYHEAVLFKLARLYLLPFIKNETLILVIVENI